MTFGCYNKMNMLGMGNMFGFGNMLGGTNAISQLFSGTNSIFGGGFNMYGNYGTGSCGLFMDCKGNYNYDAMAGFALGGVLLNAAGSAVGTALQNKQENSVENLNTKLEETQKSLETKEKNLETKQDELDTLNGKTEDLTNTSNEANANYDRANDYLNTNKAAYDAAIQKRDKNNETLSEQEKNIIANYENYRKEIPTLKNEKDAAAQKLEAHLEEVKKKEEELASAKEEVEKVKEELNDAQEAVEAAKFDELDGNKLNRVSDKKYNAKFKTNEKGEATSEFEGTPEFSKKDLRKALYLFSKADENNKEVYKEQFNKIYTHLLENGDSEELDGMTQAYKLINKK